MSNYRNNRNYENLERRIFDGVGEYDIPELKPTHFDGNCEFISFNCAANTKDREKKGVHFFIDDYQFNRLWTNIDRYVDMLSQFKYVMTPDFSHTQTSRKLSRYTIITANIGLGRICKKQECRLFLQYHGVRRILLNGALKVRQSDGTVAVSSVGCMNSKAKKELFLAGYEEMVKRLQPKSIIFYGTVPDECKGNIVRIKAFQNKFKEALCNGW